MHKAGKPPGRGLKDFFQEMTMKARNCFGECLSLNAPAAGRHRVHQKAPSGRGSLSSSAPVLILVWRTENTGSTRGTRWGTIFWYEAFSKPFSRGNGLELYRKKWNSSSAHCLKHTVSLEHEPSMNSFCRLRFLLQSHPMPKPRPQPPSAWSHYSSFSLLKETDPELWPILKGNVYFHQTPRNASPFTTHPDYQRSFCLPSHRFCRSLNDLRWFPNSPAAARLFVVFKYHFVLLLQLLTVPKIQPGAATEKPKTWHHH